MADFFQFEWGSLIAGVTTVGATVILSLTARKWSKQKQLQDWRMPLYQELIESLSKVDESVNIAISSVLKPRQSREKNGIYLFETELSEENKRIDLEGAEALDSLIRLKNEITSIKLKLLTVGTDELDRAIENLLRSIDYLNQIYEESRVYNILASSWSFEVRQANREILKIMRNSMNLSKEISPFDVEESDYTLFEEISEKISQTLGASYFTTAQKKMLLKGEILEINGIHYAWFKAKGYPGKLAMSARGKKIRSRAIYLPKIK